MDHYCPNCNYTYPSIYDRGECCPICQQEGYPTDKNQLTNNILDAIENNKNNKERSDSK
jgi:uncharacterized paraquat-inducible protein A